MGYRSNEPVDLWLRTSFGKEARKTGKSLNNSSRPSLDWPKNWLIRINSYRARRREEKRGEEKRGEGSEQEIMRGDVTLTLMGYAGFTHTHTIQNIIRQRIQTKNPLKILLKELYKFETNSLNEFCKIRADSYLDLAPHL